jgi:hypothetical protein
MMEGEFVLFRRNNGRMNALWRYKRLTANDQENTTALMPEILQANPMQERPPIPFIQDVITQAWAI